MKSNTKRLMICFVMMGLFAVLAAGSGEDTTKTNSTSAKSDLVRKEKKNAKDKEKENKNAVAKEGISSNVLISVLSSDNKENIGDEYTKKKAQGVFKVVKIKITNNQKDAITIDSNSFKLIDDKGREFSHSLEGQMAISTSNNEVETFFLKSLNPGLSIEGYIVFDIPKDAKGLYMKAHGGMLGEEINLKID